MSYRRSHLLFDSTLVRVFDVTCHAPRSGCTGEEWSRVAEVVVTRRGVFMLNRRGGRVVADSNTVLVFGVDDYYQVSHPVEGGDQCTVLVFRPEVLEDALGSRDASHGTLQATTQLAMHLFASALVNGAIDHLEAEDGALLLLDAMSNDIRPNIPSNGGRVGQSQRRRVEEVRALLASHPTVDWCLDSVSRAVYCSPFHLARQFRAVTGESISRYLLRLRLGLALHRIAQGESHLDRLAVELRFAHHSHFSARFRSLFGMTPSAARHSLTRGGLRKMSTILTASTGVA